MNKRGILTAGIVILLSLLAVSCTFESVENGSGSFAYDLRGLWTSVNTTSVYKGTLKITYDTITITGYDQGSVSERPFNGYFYQGITHDGYSEDHKVFIKKGDVWQAGILYDYTTENNGTYEFLEFPTWGETLQKRSFASDLHGTWESYDTSDEYSGTIKITDDTITITGYTNDQGYYFERPFYNCFHQGITHTGYSDSNTHQIFIEKDLKWQTGISYFYNTESKFLEFTFGNRIERLRRKSY